VPAGAERGGVRAEIEVLEIGGAWNVAILLSSKSQLLNTSHEQGLMHHIYSGSFV